MHVVMLSDAETAGGAATGTSRLAEALIRQGVRVTRIVNGADHESHPWSTHLLRGRGTHERTWNALQRLGERVSFRLAVMTQRPIVYPGLRRLLREFSPDVIQVNNLPWAGWWPEIVAVCREFAPVVWTLRDMWSFTGRCGYSGDCRRFLTGCDAQCPTPQEWPPLAPHLIEPAWRMRRRLLEGHPDLTAVCPSRWMAQEALAGLWKGHRVEVIPNGVPTELYSPMDRELARRALRLDPEGTVLLYSAHSLVERRSGGPLLQNAIPRSSSRSLTLLTMGGNPLAVQNEGISVRAFGYVHDALLKVLLYSAADALIHPAVMDNHSHTILESLACGTPVIGLAVGGVVDSVRQGTTGWLAPEATAQALAETIDLAIRDILSGKDLRSSCRTVAEREYSLELQAQRYIELFQSLRRSG